jgi:hypothetical protein
VVFASVCLGARRLHRRAFRAIQHSKLDAGCVCRQAHQPAQSIDLARDLSLAQTPDSRIAAHLGYGVFADSYKARFSTDFRGGVCSLDAGVTSTYNNTIELVCFRSVEHIKKLSHRAHREHREI